MLETKFTTNPIPLYTPTSTVPTNYMYGKEPFAIRSGTVAALVSSKLM